MILAIDTATRWTGLALHDGTAVLAEAGWRSRERQTVSLAPAVATLLEQSGVTVSDVKGIAVSLGPGSYTGLRVGLGFAKGIALANQIPLIGVPTMDIVAASLAGMSGELIVIAEAGRGRVCAAFYKWKKQQGWEKSGRPLILGWSELLEDVAGPAFFAGEIPPEAAKKIRAAGKQFKQVPAAASVRRAGYLAEIGWLRLRKKRVDDAASLAPIYLRDPAGA